MKKYKFTIRGNEYDVEIKSFDEGIAKLEVNGTKYKVEVHKEIKETKTPKLVRKPVPVNGGSKIKKTTNQASIKAPLPGNILQVFVKPGDEVTVGQKLLIMEAMKMENNINSDKDAVVKSVKVAAGDAVLQDTVLVEFE